MQEIAARETMGAGSGQLQVIRTTDPVRDRRSITVEVGGRLENISLAEMEFYCDLFEEMFVELDRRGSYRIDNLEGLLDEIGRAAIERPRLRDGTSGPF
ncbi:hypothetical protein H8E65_04325 [Candidatus Bathyarchaeota archaeon]|nr:hypothetical protein [Candidatus Bathyarchaeota archaeon]